VEPVVSLPSGVLLSSNGDEFRTLWLRQLWSFPNSDSQVAFDVVVVEDTPHALLLFTTGCGTKAEATTMTDAADSK